MTSASNDRFRHHLGESLAGLEGGGASPGFTSRVLHELEARQLRRRKRRKQALSAVAVLLVAALAGVLGLDRPVDTTVDVASEAKQLRQEYTRLQNDLEALRESARETAPVLYLGGNDELDLILDLAPIITRSGATVVPASSVQVDPYEL